MTANHRTLDEPDLALIEKVKATPALYDAVNPDFKFAYRKEQHWHNLAMALGLKAADARRRWTCLRDRYTRELKQMRLQPDKSDYGSSDFFKQMDFLRKFVRKRRERRRSDFKGKGSASRWDDSNNEDATTKMEIHSDDITMHVSSEAIYEGDDDEETQPAQYDVTGMTHEHTTSAGNGFAEYYVEERAPQESCGEYVEVPHTELAEANTRAMPHYSAVPASCPEMKPMLAANTVKFIPVGAAKNPIDIQNPTAMAECVTIEATPPIAKMTTNGNNNANANGNNNENANVTEDDFFCKTIGVYLRKLSYRHKIKAKVEMLQILDKYIELEEVTATARQDGV